MDELVEIINQLQEVFSVIQSPEIDLPQIVVVGAQSSGKSSVLEHIVGKSFLPRGVGIVTRCPLILQLVRAPGKTGDEEEYAIFQSDKSKTYTDFELITKAIEEETDRLAGENNGICHTPIMLKLFSPSFINLTLVDLPGLTKVPVGDQPYDIENQIKKLILNYVENPNSIILAVSAANVDLATSESLKMAREVDPDGKRTLAIITKLDLMDEGTDAWDMLQGKVIPVKLGIVGVVNRSQKDIQDDKSIAKSLEDEQKFFNTHYKSIASINGCDYLKKKVQAILVNHIKTCLPQLREKIKDKLSEKNKELEQIKETQLDKPTLLLDLLTKFASNYMSLIKGKLTDSKTEELYGGATICHVFQVWLSKELDDIHAQAGLDKSFVMAAMKNSSGVNAAIFVPEIAFQSLVVKQIEQFRIPSLECIDMVHRELSKIILICIEESSSGLELYPKVQTELETVVLELLLSRLPFTKQAIEELINAQKAFINTVHPDFMPNTPKKVSKGSQTLDKDDYFDCPTTTVKDIEMKKMKVLTHDQKMNRDYGLIIELIESYFSIVRTTIKDQVPKIIMHLMVNFVVENLHMELMKWLHKSNPDDLLQELNEVTQKRKELKKLIEALNKANYILNNISSKARMQCQFNFQE